MRKGVYAGPVTDGKHDVTEHKLPSSRNRPSAGSAPCCSAASRVSGRAPSASRMTTDNDGQREGGEGKLASVRTCLNPVNSTHGTTREARAEAKSRAHR